MDINQVNTRLIYAPDELQRRSSTCGTRTNTGTPMFTGK